MNLRILAPVLVLFGLIVPRGGMAQRIMHGKVEDAATLQPLPGAHIRIGDAQAGAVADRDGVFALPIGAEDRMLLEVSYTGYATLRKALERDELEEPLVLAMHREAVVLGPAIVVADPGPEVVYRDAELHVGAFLAADEGIWVLTYERPQLWHSEADAGLRVMRVARIVLLDTLFREVARARVPEDACGLAQDFAGRAVVEGRRCAWFPRLDGDSILFSRMDMEQYHQAVRPWTDSLAGRLIGSNRDVTYPAFDHIAHDLSDGTDRIICSIRDEETMSLFRSQYKYMSGRDKVFAMDLEKETGVDREVIAGYMTGFQHDLYFHEPYAPLFVSHDTLLVFDHYKERLRRFVNDASELDGVAIGYHRMREWTGRLVQDRITGLVHALFRRGSRLWVRRIDQTTGELGQITELEYPFPEEVQVCDGWAYYVYRPYGSLQRRTLYRERLR